MPACPAAPSATTSSGFRTVRGFPRTNPYYGPLWQGALVSMAWGLPCLVLARRALLSRDIT